MPYQENPAHRPNLTDAAGTIETTNLGAGKWGRVETASAAFPHAGPPEVESQRAAALRPREEQAAQLAEAAEEPVEAEEEVEAEAEAEDAVEDAVEVEGDSDPEMNLDELKEIAKELKVKGRSGMNKAALAAAVAEAQSSSE